MNHPTAYVIAGPNGAGKTTFATEFLPDFVNCREFLNADLIAAGLSPFAPESQNIGLVDCCWNGSTNSESSKKTSGLRQRCRDEATLICSSVCGKKAIGLSCSFCGYHQRTWRSSRVVNRVRQGGHSVPENDIRRRYLTGQRNLFRLYRPLVDAWWLYDASHLPPDLIAGEEDGSLDIRDANKFVQIQSAVTESTHD
jgi:predicted ABC-type ATPase